MVLLNHAPGEIILKVPQVYSRGSWGTGDGSGSEIPLWRSFVDRDEACEIGFLTLSRQNKKNELAENGNPLYYFISSDVLLVRSLSEIIVNII